MTTQAHMIPSRAKGVLALLGLVLAGGALIIGAAGLHATAKALEPLLEAERQRLEVLRRQLARERNAAVATGAAGKVEGLALLPGGTTGLAVAHLQGVLVRLAQAHGGTVESAQVMITEPSADQIVDQVAVSVAMTVTLEGLRDFLLAVEAGRPFIFVDDLVVTPSQQVGASASALLSVTARASGFIGKKP